MDHQAEQVQVERPECQVEDRADEHRRDRALPGGAAPRRLPKDGHGQPEAASGQPAAVRGLRQLDRLRVAGPMGGEPTQELPENAPTRIGRDREVNLVEVNDQAEQVQVERPERQIEDRADPLRGREPANRLNADDEPLLADCARVIGGIGDRRSKLRGRRADGVEVPSSPYEPVDPQPDADRSDLGGSCRGGGGALRLNDAGTRRRSHECERGDRGESRHRHQMRARHAFPLSKGILTRREYPVAKTRNAYRKTLLWADDGRGRASLGPSPRPRNAPYSGVSGCGG